jgi:hypothetical protein
MFSGSVSIFQGLARAVLGTLFTYFAKGLNTQIHRFVMNKGEVRENLAQSDSRSVFFRDEYAVATQFPEPGVNGHGYGEGSIIPRRHGMVAKLLNESGQGGSYETHLGVTKVCGGVHGR